MILLQDVDSLSSIQTLALNPGVNMAKCQRVKTGEKGSGKNRLWSFQRLGRMLYTAYENSHN